jgi:hypothetical protein
MTSKKEFNGMGYRQIQQSNSDNKTKLKPEEIKLLKNTGYRNVGWDKVIQLYPKIQEMLDSPYRGDWSLGELFVEADRIGQKYQYDDEIETFERKFEIVSQEIETEIDRHFPDTEVEIIDFARRRSW